MSLNKKGVDALLEEYSRKKEAIRKRLDDFRRVGSDSSEERLFAELAFCLCTPQSKAKTCWAAVTGIEKSGLLLSGGSDEISKNLKGVRFHRNKARYIEEARAALTTGGKLDVRGAIFGNNREPGNESTSKKRHGTMNGPSCGSDSVGAVIEAREWLIANIKGLGYKEASHFLRNIGMGQGIAILDRHILKNLKLLGVIDEVPKSLTRKKYMEIEQSMSDFCNRTGVPEEELDLLLWSREAGEIFK
jgi:N-glycosylase/DNA lyase